MLLSDNGARRGKTWGSRPQDEGIFWLPIYCCHVWVAPSIENNKPETMERSRRSFPTAGGWFFAGLRRHGGMVGRGALMLRSIAARTARCFQRLGCAAMRLEA